MMELTMNTITAETTMGSQSDWSETAMSTSLEWLDTSSTPSPVGSGSTDRLIDPGLPVPNRELRRLRGYVQQSCIDGHAHDGVDPQPVQLVDLCLGRNASSGRQLSFGRLRHTLDRGHVRALHEALFVHVRVEKLA